MRIRKNSLRLLSDGRQQTPPSCQPARSLPTHSARDVVKNGDEVTTNKRCDPTPPSERLCGSNKDCKMEDNYEDYYDFIPCRDGLCNCVDGDLKMDGMLENCTSKKHKVVKNMKQDVFLENKMDRDGKIMKAEESNYGMKCKEEVIPTLVSQHAPWTSSKLNEVNDLVSRVVTSTSEPTSSNQRKRRKVAYGSGQDYLYYTQFGSCPMKEHCVRRKKRY